jgi:hypothetical protein
MRGDDPKLLLIVPVGRDSETTEALIAILSLLAGCEAALAKGAVRGGFFVAQQQRPRRNVGLASGECPRLYYVRSIALSGAQNAPSGCCATHLNLSPATWPAGSFGDSSR